MTKQKNSLESTHRGSEVEESKSRSREQTKKLMERTPFISPSQLKPKVLYTIIISTSIHIYTHPKTKQHPKIQAFVVCGLDGNKDRNYLNKKIS